MLETARFDQENYRSYLFSKPLRVLAVSRLGDIPRLFQEIEDCLHENLFVAGFISFECGYHFQGIAQVGRDLEPCTPLAWFGAYSNPLVYDHRKGCFAGTKADFPAAGPAPAESGDFEIRNVRFEISPDEYVGRIGQIKDYIAAGHTYQVNFTDKVRFDFSGSPAALFACLRSKQRVSYSAFLHTGNKQILSFSPELFFRICNGRIITKPMKGTARRGRGPAEDAAIARWLQGDAKNRSENVMIVDLLRNDLGRVAEVGSVKVDDLFVVERYETLFQMTSTISATLQRGLPIYVLWQSVFPSGSVTGAPKIRTMELISELERNPRGVYTGAIGFFAPGGDAVFNVAIRTIVLDGQCGEMGVGSGIVFDSVAEEEYAECKLKMDFLVQPRINFQLLESILWDGEYVRLPQHLHRLSSSAEYFGFPYEPAKVLRELEANKQHLSDKTRAKVRLLLNEQGMVTLENHPFADESDGPRKIMLSACRTSSEDRFLYHKTTHRELYDRLYAQAREDGFEDVIFRNEKDQITEGAVNNIFVEKDGALQTPPISCGLLPGVFRQQILDAGYAIEKILELEDLKHADAIYLCNAIRGVRKVILADRSQFPGDSPSHRTVSRG